jgi:hypothetical protein
MSNQGHGCEGPDDLSLGSKNTAYGGRGLTAPAFLLSFEILKLLGGSALFLKPVSNS